MSATATARIYAMVDAQLAEERANKASLESRASNVITTAGGLTTLFLAIGAVVSGVEHFRPQWWEIVPIALAIGAFIVSAWSALTVASPVAYKELSVKDLRNSMTTALFATPDDVAGPDLTAPLLDILEASRTANADKASRLSRAISFEVVGVVLVALGAITILVTALVGGHAPVELLPVT